MTAALRIAVVGAGRMGSALARSLHLAGHEVTLSHSRSPEKLVAAAAATGARAETAGRAVEGAEVVLVCLPPEAFEVALSSAGTFAGQVVVSVSSGLSLDPTGETMGLPTSRTQSVAETLAQRFPGARVVQALTSVFAERLVMEQADAVAAVMPLAGDDPIALEIVADLIRDLGFVPITAGPLRASRALETLATALAQFAIVAKLAPNLGLALGGLTSPAEPRLPMGAPHA